MCTKEAKKHHVSFSILSKPQRLEHQVNIPYEILLDIEPCSSQFFHLFQLFNFVWLPQSKLISAVIIFKNREVHVETATPIAKFLIMCSKA